MINDPYIAAALIGFVFGVSFCVFVCANVALIAVRRAMLKRVKHDE